ncbi:MAG: HAD family phosphatase [Chloroflexi bacterium]|nr:HAD family phosphatase [Chloroflexota bacterium]
MKSNPQPYITSPSVKIPPNLPYRLLALDLDGTVLHEDLTVSTEVRGAIAAAQAAGVVVTLATGRGFEPVVELARELSISAPLICFQGALVQHPQSGAMLYQATMPPELAVEVVHFARQRSMELYLYVGDQVLTENLCRPADFYRRWYGQHTCQVEDLLAVAGSQPVIKFLLVVDPADAQGVYVEWRARFEPGLQIVRSHAMFVEGGPPGVTKGAALAWLARHLGIAQHEVMAIGDNDNDRPMLQWAGLGVAMGNAPFDLQAVADAVAPSIQEDGAAFAIRHFILGEDTTQARCG